MLFCRIVAVLFSLGGSVWCATTPLPRRGPRPPGISKTTHSSDHFPVLRGEVLIESATAWIGASSDSGKDDIEGNSDEVFGSTSTAPFRTSRTIPAEDPEGTAWISASSDKGNDGIERNSDEVFGSTSATPLRTSDDNPGEDSDVTARISPSSASETDDVFPPEKRTTTFFHSSTDDELRTRRGIVIVDDDFNVSPGEPSQGWTDPTKTTSDEGSGQEDPTSTPSPEIGSGDDDDSPSEPWRLVLCFNTTCDSRDMSVFPGHDEIVPVGTNLSLSCVQSNDSDEELRWYKYDDDCYPLLLQSSESELTLAIPKSGTEDSGSYVCLRGSKTSGSCCHRTLHVKVYEVPNYRYHLIVVGVVAAVGLFACILIGVCRNYKTKKYEVQLELQNVEADCVYKL